MAKNRNPRPSDPKRSPQARRQSIERRQARTFAKKNARKY